MLKRLLERLTGSGSAPSAPGPIRLALRLYKRADCPLCDELHAQLERCAVPCELEVREVWIDGDPALEERYGRSIPVLTLGERALVKGRIELAELEAKLARVAREAAAGAEGEGGGQEP